MCNFFFFSFLESGKTVLDKLAQETKASVLNNLTNIVDGLDLIRDDLYKINELTEKLHKSSSLLDVGECERMKQSRNCVH